MGRLRDFHRKLSSITESQIDNAILNIVDEFSATAIDMNTSQLLKGKDSEGNLLNPEYKSEKYEQLKRILNPAANGLVDLKFNGGFHRSFFLTTTKFPVYFYASDYKTSSLRKKYGINIFGVDTADLEDLVQNYYKEQIQDYFRTEVFKL